MARNIVVCCDGTGCQFGTINSNVVKLYSVLEFDPDRQIAFYGPGLGTMGAPSALTKTAQAITRLLGLAFGYGLTKNLSDAYVFLMNHYQSEDRVFLFGFSRGAYTARALAGLLHMYGLIRPGNEVLVPYALRMFKHRNRDTFRVAGQFKATFSRECKPHFVGVWDTVSSVGWIYNPVKLPYTAQNPDVRTGRHAVSIDERRSYYRQNLWGRPAAGQDLKQAWFAGAHSDVGGGYPEAESGLSKIALEWMIREARQAHLLVDLGRLNRMLGRDEGGLAPPDPKAMPHDSLKGFWWALEFWPKRYMDVTQEPPAVRWTIPLGRRRWIPEHALIHASVLRRGELLGEKYQPPNLPREYEVEPG